MPVLLVYQRTKSVEKWSVKIKNTDFPDFDLPLLRGQIGVGGHFCPQNRVFQPKTAQKVFWFKGLACLSPKLVKKLEVAWNWPYFWPCRADFGLIPWLKVPEIKTIFVAHGPKNLKILSPEQFGGHHHIQSELPRTIFELFLATY